MSKSNGEFLTVSLLKDKAYDPLSFRFMCLNSHYRKQLVFTYDALNQAEATLKKLRNKISSINDEGELNKELFDNYNNKFMNSLEEDLNTANALAVLYEMLKDGDVNGHTKLELISNLDEILAVELIKEVKRLDNEAEILDIIEKRNKAKKDKDFELADSIRNELLSKGIELIDTREGTTYRIVGE